MVAENTAPETLLEAVNYFSDKDLALEFAAAIRWPEGVICPDCAEKQATFLKSRRLWKCRACKRQFSVKVGSIFEDSPIGLDKWLPAMWLIVNCKNGISSYELARDLKVTQKTAWFMLHRIRLAMQANSFEKMSGEIEVDETFIGGKARFMNKERRERRSQKAKGRTHFGKVAVMGLLDRHGKDGVSQVRTQIVPNVRRTELQQHLRKHLVMDGQTVVYSDALPSYQPKNPKGWYPSDLYTHKVVDHAERYVDGEIHTNGVENFWSLLKRCIRGTYVSIEPFHLFRYLDEQTFRFNARKLTDALRFTQALAGVFGKRLTYAALTGNQEPVRP